MALPTAAIVCIVLACWVLVVLIAFAAYQFLKSRGNCSCDCAPCGKEEQRGCCECCISLSDSCDCCNPSVNGCLDKLCPGKKKVSCVDLILCQCCAGEGEQSCCLKKTCDKPCCDGNLCCSNPVSASPICNVPCFMDSSAFTKCLPCACPRWVCDCHNPQGSCLNCSPVCCKSDAMCLPGDGCCEHYTCCCCECNLKVNPPPKSLLPGLDDGDGQDTKILNQLDESLTRSGYLLKLVDCHGKEVHGVTSISELNETIKKCDRISGPPVNEVTTTAARTLPVPAEACLHSSSHSYFNEHPRTLPDRPVAQDKSIESQHHSNLNIRSVMSEDRFSSHNAHHSLGSPRQPAKYEFSDHGSSTPKRKKRPKKYNKVEAQLATCSTEVIPLGKRKRKSKTKALN